VEVLGTHFNIMSYEDEGQIATTLLEGAVKVSKVGQTRLMKPGQQVVWNQNNQFVMNNDVDIDEVIAWEKRTVSF
jgi:ferric-dicitrate binding protein FerR (iron transport regulator)